MASQRTSTTRTLLSLIRQEFSGPLGPAEIDISTGPLGSTRGKMLDQPPSQQVVVLTHQVYRQGEAIFLGKYLILPEIIRLVVRQPAL